MRKICEVAFLSHLYWGLTGNARVLSIVGKRVIDFLSMVVKHFSYSS